MHRELFCIHACSGQYMVWWPGVRAHCLHLKLVLRWPCAADRTLKSSYKLLSQAPQHLCFTSVKPMVLKEMLAQPLSSMRWDAVWEWHSVRDGGNRSLVMSNFSVIFSGVSAQYCFNVSEHQLKLFIHVSAQYVRACRSVKVWLSITCKFDIHTFTPLPIKNSLTVDTYSVYFKMHDCWHRIHG